FPYTTLFRSEFQVVVELAINLLAQREGQVVIEGILDINVGHIISTTYVIVLTCQYGEGIVAVGHSVILIAGATRDVVIRADAEAGKAQGQYSFAQTAEVIQIAGLFDGWVHVVPDAQINADTT